MDSDEILGISIDEDTAAQSIDNDLACYLDWDDNLVITALGTEDVLLKNGSNPMSTIPFNDHTKNRLHLDT